MISPKISVIIPVYNSGSLILETLHSVFAQTYTHFEIILIDDGSTDNTLEIVRTIDDERLQVFSYENGGLAKARNRGISQATGDFIAFLDHDDLWTASKLEDQLNALLANPSAGIAYSWTTYFCDLETTERRYRKGMEDSIEGHIYPQLLLQNFIESGSNILVRREVVDKVGGFDAHPVCNEDWDYYLRLAADWPFVLVKKFQILYRQDPGSMSSWVKKFENGGIALIQKTYQTAPPNLQKLKRTTLSNHYSYCSDLYLNQSYRQGTSFEAMRSIGLSIYHHPQVLLQKQFLSLLIKLLLRILLSPAQFSNLQRKKQGQWLTEMPIQTSA